MLTKDDKAFIITAISENNVVTNENIRNAIAENNVTLFDLFNHLDQKMDHMERNLKDEIRHNGVLIEQNSDRIQILGEGQSTMNRNISRLENDIKSIKENTETLPMMRKMLESHHRKLEAVN